MKQTKKKININLNSAIKREVHKLGKEMREKLEEHRSANVIISMTKNKTSVPLLRREMPKHRNGERYGGTIHN